MPKDWVQIEKAEGAKRIQEYCGVAANSMGLALMSTCWSTDIVEENKKYILTIEAKTGTTQIRFSLEEIEQYSEGKNTEATNARIKMELNEIL
jgi:hypothetical protein